MWYSVIRLKSLQALKAFFERTEEVTLSYLGLNNRIGIRLTDGREGRWSGGVFL